MSPVRHRYVEAAPSPPGQQYTAAEFVLLAEQFRRVPEGMRRSLARRLRPVGERALATARRKAAWSTRIPSAIGLRLRFTGKGAGLSLVVDHKAAPHARPYEGLLSRVFRHPLFGNRDFWFSQDARPFVWPAVLDTQQEIASEVDEAIDEALGAAGFH